MLNKKIFFPWVLGVAFLPNRMVGQRILFSTFFTLLFIFLPSFAAGSRNSNVLILNSYHKGLDWTDHQVSAAEQVLRDEFNHINLFVEYMDTKRYYNTAYLERLRSIYKAKFANVKLDAILTTDDNALRFVLNHHKEVFGKAPVSFCGINDYQESALGKRQGFTGLIEVLDVKPTIDLALELHPQTQKIFVVVDSTPTGMGQRRDVASVAKRYDNLEFEYLKGEDLAHKDLLEKLRHLPGNSIVLLTVWLRDKNNTYRPPNEGGPQISSSSSVPVYGIVDMYLGHGIVGGKLLNSDTHGEYAAKIALRILNGIKPSDIPIIAQSVNPYLFDYQQIERWKIDPNKLPENSIIINKPFSLYEEYRTLFWVTGAMLLILSVLVVSLFGNILKRRKVEEALKESKSFLALLIRAIPDLVWLKDPNGIYLACNPRFEEFFGAREREIIGKTDYDFVDEKLADFFRERDKEAIEKGEACINEEEVPFAADGHWEILETIKTPIFKSNGELAGVLGTGRNITGRKRAEEKLKETTMWLEEAVKAGNVGLWDWDLKTNKVFYSTEWKKQIGYEDDELGDDFEEWKSRIHPEDLEKTLTHVERMVDETRASYQMEFRFRHKDGSYRWILAAATVIRDKNGVPIRALGSHLDITERKKIETAIAQSEKRMNLALDSVRDAVWDWRVDSGEVYFSTRWYTMLDFEPYELPLEFETWKKLVHPEDLPQAEKTVFEHLETAEPFEIEFRMKTKNNQWKDILARGKAVEKDATGKAIRMLGTHVDITERKKLDEQLRQAHKMESIGTLAGGIAHDFNNILTPILVQTELAKMSIEGNHTVQGNLDEIMQAGHRAKDLVTQILTFSRQSEQKAVSMDLVPLVKESLKLLRSSIPRTIEISQDIQKDPCTVKADPTQIQQIIMNLCTNAAQAMKDMGSVLGVSLQNVGLTNDDLKLHPDMAPGNYVLLTVSDTGSGIAPDIIDKIFDPFFTTKPSGEGTGMGLAVVHGIVHSNGGTISVHSEPGKGTTFEVYLPKAERGSDQEIKEISHVLPRGNERILFVDDEKALVKLGEQMLERLGYQVESRTSSIEALAAFQNRPDEFDLVMTDMTMPNMTGDGLAKELMKIRPDLPVIICTGFSHQIDERKAQAIGIRAFVKKPFLIKEVAETIRRVLDVSSG